MCFPFTLPPLTPTKCSRLAWPLPIIPYFGYFVTKGFYLLMCRTTPSIFPFSPPPKKKDFSLGFSPLHSSVLPPVWGGGAGRHEHKKVLPRLMETTSLEPAP